MTVTVQVKPPVSYRGSIAAYRVANSVEVLGAGCQVCHQRIVENACKHMALSKACCQACQARFAKSTFLLVLHALHTEGHACIAEAPHMQRTHFLWGHQSRCRKYWNKSVG